MDEFLGGIETCCNEDNNHKKSSLPRNVPQLVSTEIMMLRRQIVCCPLGLARQKFAYQHIVALSERLEKIEACDLVLCALFLLAKLPRRTILTLLEVNRQHSSCTAGNKYHINFHNIYLYYFKIAFFDFHSSI